MARPFQKEGGGAPLDRRYVLARPLSWTVFPFAASMADYGSGFQECGYAKDSLGVVHLRGLLAMTGVPANPQLLGTLPAGFRPSATELFDCMGSYAGGNVGYHVDVDLAGVVQVYTATGALTWDGAFLSLSGITFDGN